MKKVLLLLLLFATIPLTHAQDTATMQHDDMERSYLLYVPDSYADNTPAPLYVMLHGGNMSGAEMYAVANFNRLAEQYGALVVYPDGIEHYWRSLDADEYGISPDEYVNDIAFIPALIDDISATYAVDADRIYISGYSNGGMMALRLACEHSDIFAAAAIIGANFTDLLARHCVDMVTPIPIVMVVSTDDTAFPAEGFATAEDGFLTLRLSFSQSLSFMNSLYGCTQSESIELSPEESSHVVLGDVRFGCDNEAFVLMYTLVGHSHAYPVTPRLWLQNGEVGRIAEAVWEMVLSVSK